MGRPLEVSGRRLVWSPDRGPQAALVSCPVYEVFYGGARGGGKTDGMIGDWIFHQDLYRGDAAGVFFRKTLRQLEAVVHRSFQVFKPLGAKFHKQDKLWEFPNGALLKFRYLDGLLDAENYQGHSYTRLYFEEVTNWATPDAINAMRATLRSPVGVPVGLRMTGNPGGVGHGWVKQRFVDAGEPMRVIRDADSGKSRVYIPSRLENNVRLRGTDYADRLHEVGRPELVKAWLEGDWNVIAGAFLSSVWRSEVHVVDPFEIPAHWLRWRSMDWGFARPYAVLWFAQDERGNVFVYRERYGIALDAAGRFMPNVGSREAADAVAKVVADAEALEVKAGIEIRGNPADPAIWSNTGTELSIEEYFRRGAVTWWKADNAAGSRKQGAQEVVRRLQSGGLKFFRGCVHTIRTVSAIPTSLSDPEDVDTAAEDHAWDALRYGLRRRKPQSDAPEKAVVDQFAWMRRLG